MKYYFLSKQLFILAYLFENTNKTVDTQERKSYDKQIGSSHPRHDFKQRAKDAEREA